MAKKKMSNQSKQQQQQQHEENGSQPQPPTSSDNKKLESLKNLNSLLLKETTQRRQQVESLESHLSNTVDDNVVSELEKSVAFAFIKSRVEEMGFVFSSDKHDTEHVVSELGFEVEELKCRLSEVREERDRLRVDFDGVVVDGNLMKEKVREVEIREEKVLEELRKLRSEMEKLMEEGFRKEKVIEEVTSGRDSAVSKWRDLNEKVVEAENRENKVLQELRKVRVEGEKLGLEKDRVIVEVREERDSAVRDLRKLKEKLLEADDSNKRLLEELQKVRLEGEKLVEEGCWKERVISEVTVERDSAVRDSRELKGKLLEAENSNKNLLEELQKVRLEGEKLTEEGRRKERVIGEVTVERDSAVRNSRELKETLLEAENSKRKLLEELQKLRLEGEKLIEEGCQKERLIGEVTSERDSAVRSLQVSVMEIEKLKGEMNLVMREKDEISKVNDAQMVKISSMELELVHVNEALNDVCREEKLMRGKILELENKVGIYVKKEDGLMLQIRDLVKQKEEMEVSVEMLKKGRDSVEKVLDEVRKELEYKQCEIEKAKVRYMKEITEVQNIANELNQSCKVYEKKNSELFSDVESYMNAVKEVTIERDNIRRTFEEEKNKAKNLMLQIAEMKGKTEALASEIGIMKSEKVQLLEKNEMMESRVSILMDEKDALQRSLLDAQRECDEVRAKVEFYSLNSNQVLEMLKNAAALVCQDMEGVEEVVSNEQKPEEEIRLYAEQLGAIRDAFRNKNKMVADMKQQSEVLQKSVHEAHKMKSLWTIISSGASVLAAAFAAAYVAKGH